MTSARRSDPARARAARLGVLVPCRNEAAVIERKLRNLARASWPMEGRPHRLLVVDDRSEDGTGARAAELCPALFERARDGVAAELVLNDVRPGKAGALLAGLARLEADCELLVISDADVVLEPGALLALAAAFAREPSLGMASGAQVFVRSLAADGSIRAARGGPLAPAPGGWDRLTATVRRLESRAGRLFSVHGQLLAWRAELGLRPGVGVAADDLDLMLQLRQRRPELRVRLVEEARFFEERPPAVEAAQAQALRRARAYVQVFRAHPRPPRGLTARLQWWLYRTLPFAAPWACLALLLAAPFHAGALAGAPGVAGAMLALALAARSSSGRKLAELLATIARAERMEEEEPSPERWEMRRS